MNAKELVIYWKVVKKRLWLIILLVVVTLGTMAVIFYLSPPVYRATTSFQVISPLPAEVTIFREFRTESNRNELSFTRNNFLKLLQSEFVLRQVIKDLNLNMTPEALLEEQLVLEADDTSDFVTLSVTADNPNLAATIVNTILERAATTFGELSAGSITANKDFIQQQLQKSKEELDRAKTELIQFQIENRVGSLDALLGKQQSIIADLKLSRDTALVSGDQAVALQYDKIIAEREVELQDLILLTLEEDTLQRNVGTIAKTYEDLQERETEANLKENEILSAKFVQIIPAFEPEYPLPRYNITLLILGAVVSLVLGIVISFLIEALQDLSSASGEEIRSRESMLGAPAE